MLPPEPQGHGIEGVDAPITRVLDLAASGFILSRKSAAQLAKLRRLEEFVNVRMGIT